VLAIVSAILIEDLGECFDFSLRRRSERPNRNTIVGGCRSWMGVPTHGFVDDKVSLDGSDLALGQRSGMSCEETERPRTTHGLL
jgi:hypothetical protein